MDKHLSYVSAFPVAVLLLATPAQAQSREQQQQIDWCKNQGNRFSQDLSINGCTAVIRSGDWALKNLAWAFHNRGLAHYRKRDYERAIVDLSEAIRLNPTAASNFFLRHYVYAAKNDYDRAIADLDEAGRLDLAYVDQQLAKTYKLQASKSPPLAATNRRIDLSAPPSTDAPQKNILQADKSPPSATAGRRIDLSAPPSTDAPQKNTLQADKSPPSATAGRRIDLSAPPSAGAAEKNTVLADEPSPPVTTGRRIDLSAPPSAGAAEKNTVLADEPSPSVTTGRRITLSANDPKKPAPPALLEDYCVMFEGEIRRVAGRYTYSSEFRRSVRRFVDAGCRAADAEGPIDLVSMTLDDSKGLLTALMVIEALVGIKVRAVTGVGWCNNPPDGRTCGPKLTP